MPQLEAVPERRYLTVMFADLVGYTALSERLDPELLREVQLRYQQLAREIAEQNGGFVAAYSGDGILVYFGYPRTSENDADRAVRTALEILPSIGQLDLTEFLAPAEALAARIALHTGLVVVGPEVASMGVSVHGAVGEAVNLAARLQAEAEPNSVVISSRQRNWWTGYSILRRLDRDRSADCRGRFRYIALSPHGPAVNEHCAIGGAERSG